MLSYIRRQMTATNALVVAALVFAMAGGAVAATGGGGATRAAGHAQAAKKKGKKGKGANGVKITSIKQLSKSVIEALRGAEGKAGPAGPAGPAGKNGINGTNGTNGGSVTATSFEGEEGGCLEGGVKLVSPSGTSYVCNGAEGRTGTEGKEGALGTAGTTLPSEASETGSWVVDTNVKHPQVAISFPIPLATALAAGHAHVINTSGEEQSYNFLTKEVVELKASAACPGTVAEPTAAAGNLCIYTESALAAMVGSNMVYPPSEKATLNPLATTGSAGTTGARMLLVNEQENEEGEISAWGSWAVTAAE